MNRFVNVSGRRSLQILQLLLRCGSSHDHRDRGGRTPLHIAAKAGRPDLVRELLIGGSLVNATDSSGQSAIHLATSHDITGKVTLVCSVV